MARVVPVFIFLNEASIYTYLALDLVDLVLWGGVWTPSYHRPFKLWFEFQVHLDQLFARQGWGQRLNNLLIFLDELTGTDSRFMLSSFSTGFSSAWRLLFPLSCFFTRPMVSRG